MLFYGKKIVSLFIFMFKTQYLEGSQTIFEKIDFLRKGFAIYTFLGEKFCFE